MRAPPRPHESGRPSAAPRELRTSRRPARRHASAEIEGRERRILEQLDREPALADEQLRGGDVDGPRGLQGDDAVDPSGGEVAQRQCERPHHANAAGEIEHRADAIDDDRRRRSLEGQDLDRVLRTQGAEPHAVQERAFTALGRPLLARPEVVDVPEGHVSHRRALGHREREREERDPALGVDRPVDRIDDDSRRASGAEHALPELLRDEHEVVAEGSEPLDDRILRRLVDRRRVVASLSALQHGLPFDARRQPLEHVADVRDAKAARLEPRGHVVTGWNRRPDRGFGIEVRALRRHALAAPRRREYVVDAGPAEDEGGIGGAVVDSSDDFVQAWRVPDAVEPVAVDELDVELARGAMKQADVSLPIPDHGRAVVWRVLEPHERVLEARGRLVVGSARDIGTVHEHAMGRIELEARVVRRYHERHDADG